MPKPLAVTIFNREIDTFPLLLSMSIMMVFTSLQTIQELKVMEGVFQ